LFDFQGIQSALRVPAHFLAFDFVELIGHEESVEREERPHQKDGDHG